MTATASEQEWGMVIFVTSVVKREKLYTSNENRLALQKKDVRFQFVNLSAISADKNQNAESFRNCETKKMGNDQSSRQLKGLRIDEKAIEVTDFWSIYCGEVPNVNNVPQLISIFKGESVVTGQLWKNKSPLERATKNLMIYRHPSILRFVASWEKGSVSYLATERCKPLSMVLSTQNDIQICLGLRNVLCSLIFLVEKANVGHINVCMSSIYVTATGAWRLAGFEHLWPKKELSAAFLERSQPYRYKNAIDKDETKRDHVQGIEQFSFAVLCEEILSKRTGSNSATIPNIAEFRKFCVEHLRNSKAEMRPALSAILLHSYFSQEFVLIHSFLTELPLKSPHEKQTFFTGLVDRLRAFDEIIVVTELIDLILSRIVVLDETAKHCVIPFILKPRTPDDSLTEPSPLFSVETFTKYVAPKIQQLFLVRDIPIRLTLLEYFPEFMHHFKSNEILSENILPQLLLGIKDTNDQLVAATLRCLADLVPVLGSSIVIGRNRGRLFADGRPNSVIDSSGSNLAVTRWSEPRSITPVLDNVDENSTDFISASPIPDNVDLSDDSFPISTTPSRTLNLNQMPERLSPDGGEDFEIAREQPDLDDDGWSDWETDANEQPAPTIESNDSNVESAHENGDEPPANSVTQSSLATITNHIKDVKDIEIKMNKPQIHDEIDDFFKDMEPVIVKTNSLVVNHIENGSNMQTSKTKDANIEIDKNRFAMKATDFSDSCDDAAWDNDTNDWNDDS